MLSATVTGVSPSRFGVAGRKVQLDPRGSPEQLRLTSPTKPSPGAGVSKTLAVPGAAPEMMTFPGFTLSRKSGLPTVKVAAAEVELRKFASPE